MLHNLVKCVIIITENRIDNIFYEVIFMTRLIFKDICEQYLNITNEQDMLCFFNDRLCYGKFKLSSYDHDCKQLFERTIESNGAAQSALLKISNGRLGVFLDKFDFKECKNAVSGIETKGFEKMESEICSEMIGFDEEKNKIIYGIIKKAFNRDPKDGLVLCLLVSLYPCDYTDEHGNNVYLRPRDDYSYCLVQLMKKYQRLMADENFAVKHSSYPIINDFRKASERINRITKASCGRFITVSLSEQYPRINEMTLPFSYENGGRNKKTEDLSLEELFKKDTRKNIMVKGKGGCGKTYSLIGLADSLFDDENSDTIPVYVQLNDYRESCDSFLGYVYKLLFGYRGSKISPKDAWGKMEEWFENCNEQLLFLLDGFNELRSKDLQNEIIRNVKDLILNNDKIRFIITSRYDMKSHFNIGSNLSEQYSANELSTKSITSYLKCFFAGDPNYSMVLDNAMMPGKKDCVKEFLRTPMALIMYCLVNSPDLENNPINENENEDCQTYGELMHKYIEKIQTGYLGEDDEPALLPNVEKLLWCAGYYMNDKGVFNVFPSDLRDFIGNAGFHELYENFSQLTNHRFFKDIIKIEEYNYIEFIHQNYRDFFAAKFLKNILDNSGIDELNKYFGSNSISQEVMTLLADILKEYRFKDNSRGSIVQNKLWHADAAKFSKQAISQLIRIAAKGRDNDLSSFDFSGLDLSDTSLNSIKLYKDNNHYAKFDGAIINKFTLNALGQPGAIFSMLWLKNRFLVSFSKIGFFCFDMEKRKNYQVVDEYPEYAVRSAVLLNDCHILTGDDSGKIMLWEYEIDSDAFWMHEIDSKDLMSDGTVSVKVLDIVKFNGKIYVSTEGGGVWSFCCENESITEPQRVNIKFDVENSKSYPCRLTVNDENLYCSMGGIIKKTSNGNTDFSDHHNFGSVKIVDIAAVNLSFEEVLLVNIEKAGNKVNKSSMVIAVKENTEYLIIEREHDGRTGFKGWNSFSNMYEREVYLTSNIEDSPESAGLLKIFCSSTTDYSGVDYFGNNHSMSVNCAVCFKFKHKKYIATGSTERSVEILEAQSYDGTILYHLDGHDNGIHYIDIVENNEIYAAHYSGEVSKWMKFGSGWRCLEVWAPHTSWVWECRRVSIDGKNYVVSCSYDKTISVIDLQKNEMITSITEPTGRVLSFGFLSDDVILTGYDDSKGKTTLQSFKIDYSAGESTAYPESDALKKIGYDLRSIHTVSDNGKNRLLLCANTDNKQGGVFIAKSGQDKPTKIRDIEEENQKVIIRYIDQIEFNNETITACGGDYSDGSVSNKFYVTIFDNRNDRITVHIDSEDGCSALRLVEYDSNLYFIAGNYSGRIHIYFINITTREAEHRYSCEPLNDKVLNLQYRDSMVFFSTLNGMVYSFSFSDAVSGNAVPEKIFQAISGLRCCYVDLTNIDQRSELTEDFKKILGYYGGMQQ